MVGFDLHEELLKLPKKTGVYIMKDESGVVIYVGKAINLRNRVRQYFQPGSQDVPKVRQIVTNIDTFEIIVTDSEKEALILECNLIKKYRPRYNSLLKDDKTYPYIMFTDVGDYPRFKIVRQYNKNRGRYFGPYTNHGAVIEVIELLQKLWPLRQCDKPMGKNNKKDRECLNYHIGKCPGPCASHITKEAYMANVAKTLDFLTGKQDGIIKDLEQEMKQYSDNMEYEKAALARNKIFAINALNEKQKLYRFDGADQDVIAFARGLSQAFFQIFFIREGKMIGREQRILTGVDHLERKDVIAEFLKQFYTGAPFVPKEVLIEEDIDGADVFMEWLSGVKGRKVVISAPKIGEKKRLVEMAYKNASLALSQAEERVRREYDKTEGAVLELAKALDLPVETLTRIEAYDISNVQGFESVGSMVVFENGKPKWSDYRKFKIKSVVGANDYASMEEVLTRRFLRYEKEFLDDDNQKKGKFSVLPDIIFMDGGKPQMSAAESVLAAAGHVIPVCGMIKDDKHRTRGLLYNGREVELNTHSEGFKLITRIQDEVHRFALEYHKKLRQASQINSVLDEIEGVGPTRRKDLLIHFRDINAIKEATVEDLCAVKSINKKTAEAVYNFFHKS